MIAFIFNLACAVIMCTNPRKYAIEGQTAAIGAEGIYQGLMIIITGGVNPDGRVILPYYLLVVILGILGYFLQREVFLKNFIETQDLEDAKNLLQ